MASKFRSKWAWKPPFKGIQVFIRHTNNRKEGTLSFLQRLRSGKGTQSIETEDHETESYFLIKWTEVSSRANELLSQFWQRECQCETVIDQKRANVSLTGTFKSEQGIHKTHRKLEIEYMNFKNFLQGLIMRGYRFERPEDMVYEHQSQFRQRFSLRWYWLWARELL